MRVTDDDNVLEDIVLMAQAKERLDRTTLFGKWINEGHVTVLPEDNPYYITVQIEDERHREERGEFPSVALIAKLQLAIHAGRSDRNLHPAGLWGGGYVGRIGGGAAPVYHVGEATQEWWHACSALEQAYTNIASITAAVKPKKLKARWP